MLGDLCNVSGESTHRQLRPKKTDPQKVRTNPVMRRRPSNCRSLQGILPSKDPIKHIAQKRQETTKIELEDQLNK